jgi:predicted GH43/DUF377 family glycosyl hydrolase
MPMQSGKFHASKAVGIRHCPVFGPFSCPGKRAKCNLRIAVRNLPSGRKNHWIKVLASYSTPMVTARASPRYRHQCTIKDMSSVKVHRHSITLQPESERVIIRPFIPADTEKLLAILDRTLALDEEAIAAQLEAVKHEFELRHYDIESLLLYHFDKIRSHLPVDIELTLNRRLFLGATFSGEYALESAALFNPSIVPHPDQENLPDGALRFVMSLRATGEGHISSIEFRSGVIGTNGEITMDPISRYVAMPGVVVNPTYRKKTFILKFQEMGFQNEWADSAMSGLGDEFSRGELDQSLSAVAHADHPSTHEYNRTLDCIRWLADSNYELQFSPKLGINERIIFPVSANESNGIEDARFVKFTEEGQPPVYYATYTAYNGKAILPQLIETSDFSRFRVLTLNGNAVQNKGMALFPRKVGGRYAMLSRQDDENLLIMFSDNLHFWSDPELLMRPAEVWESIKIGNCGSPIETPDGWLVITHGVGPMRKYCIGAALLDLDDPTKVIGRLRDPLISPMGIEREGYVPNVVYSCGSLLHGRTVILPYAMSDKFTAFASIGLEELLAAMKY